tara:strand:- start:507 stop:614 length:108 start_codon:yes stop_codon:yes gene_type:complete
MRSKQYFNLNEIKVTVPDADLINSYSPLEEDTFIQ